MNVVCLQQAPFENPGYIAEWASSRSANLKVIPCFEGAKPPELKSCDLIVVLGGPMSVNDHARLPWLAEEQKFVAKAIEAEKKVLGICLGSQMIASILGSKVYRNTEREIGFFPIDLTDMAANSPLSSLPKKVMTFHWHGETFDLPKGTSLLATSPACKHQAFSLGENVLALQFHMEATPEWIDDLVEHCMSDLKPSQWVQDQESLIAGKQQLLEINNAMAGVLDRFTGLKS